MAKPTGVFGESGTGFVTAAQGPFECSSCLHFNGGDCDHPKIQKPVEGGDCCSYWWPARQQGNAEPQAEGVSQPSNASARIAYRGRY